jgi:hypothetical protein
MLVVPTVISSTSPATPQRDYHMPSPESKTQHKPVRVFRSIVAVILGYVIFAGGVTFIVMYSFVDPFLVNRPIWFVAVIIDLVLLGVTIGLIVSLVSGSTSPIPAQVVAGLTIGLMIGNIVMNVAIEPRWFKFCVIAVVIPTMLITDRKRALKAVHPVAS